MAVKVTIKDIASRVGCNSSTVSKALSFRKEVSSELSERIHAVAQELGYKRQLPLAQVSETISGTVLLLNNEAVFANKHDYHTLSNELWDASLLYHFSKKLMQSNLISIYHALTKTGDEGRQELNRLLKGNFCDVIIVANPDESDFSLKIIADYGIPCVTWGHNSTQTSPYCDVDNYIFGKQACQMMLERGARKIIALPSNLEKPYTKAKIQGVKAALTQFTNKYGEELNLEHLQAENLAELQQKLLHILLNSNEKCGFLLTGAAETMLLAGLLRKLQKQLSRDAEAAILTHQPKLIQNLMPSVLTWFQDLESSAEHLVQILQAELQKPKSGQNILLTPKYIEASQSPF